jgi:hypothetical protein
VRCCELYCSACVFVNGRIIPIRRRVSARQKRSPSAIAGSSLRQLAKKGAPHLLHMLICSLAPLQHSGSIRHLLFQWFVDIRRCVAGRLYPRHVLAAARSICDSIKAKCLKLKALSSYCMSRSYTSISFRLCWPSRLWQSRFLVCAVAVLCVFNTFGSSACIEARSYVW